MNNSSPIPHWFLAILLALAFLGLCGLDMLIQGDIVFVGQR